MEYECDHFPGEVFNEEGIIDPTITITIIIYN